MINSNCLLLKKMNLSLSKYKLEINEINLIKKILKCELLNSHKIIKVIILLLKLIIEKLKNWILTDLRKIKNTQFNKTKLENEHQDCISRFSWLIKCERNKI